ncbi:disulfide bond formation protein DsbB [Deinococcus grandis]|uniref:Disulfide bond formation protein DsbB n=1 Tax=Deinococcus grandis TaxID=57498 RepID=A0A117DNT2_9DEIO|nr:disulfide bond formation protein B [Deinococcus grandis]BBN94301.1 putative disulfide formation protein [Deinococcus grandis]GAQ22199.1 disulfide bond formation protein DsbB [Deinococcus grandis]
MSRDNRLYAAWVVSLIATLGSLYFSEIRHFNPCVLCWFQRICMYPLAIILGVAALTGDLHVRRYALPLAGTGVLIALYQNLETWGVVPVLRACTADPSASCGTPWPVWGMNSPLNTVLTIPVLSMIAFTLIIGLLSWRRNRTI